MSPQTPLIGDDSDESGEKKSERIQLSKILRELCKKVGQQDLHHVDILGRAAKKGPFSSNKASMTPLPPLVKLLDFEI